MRALVLTAVLAITVSVMPAVAAGDHADDAVYIVVLSGGGSGVPPHAHARRHGLRPVHVYEHALRGYAARMPPAAAARVARDEGVAFVEREVLHQPAQQTLPTGIDRVEVDQLLPIGKAEAGEEGVVVDADVAVIDTGVLPDHEDLNVEGGWNAVDPDAPGAWGDVWGPYGHGTQVAGIIGALDNDIGVVGMAPGARIWALRSCHDRGCPNWANVAAIDWVAGQKRSGTIDFAAANYSITSADTTKTCKRNGRGVNATHTAICGLVDTGVVFVMSAGNANREKDPYPEAIAVSALSDTDGRGGGAGGPSELNELCEDDVLAWFSNYSSAGRIDLAAPGYCLWSTTRDGEYGAFGGTSGAAPHVTGAAALYLHATGKAPAQDRAGVEAIRSALRADAQPKDGPCGYVDHRDGGPVLFVNGPAFKGDGICEFEGAAPPPPGEESTVTASDIGFASRGRHLDVVVALAPAVEGARVMLEVELGDETVTQRSATTDGSGIAHFRLTHQADACVTASVFDVEAAGYRWDEKPNTTSRC